MNDVTVGDDLPDATGENEVDGRPKTASHGAGVSVADRRSEDLWLAGFRGTMTADEYLREVEAEWADSVGTYFTEDELPAATVGYAMTPPPERAHGQVAAWPLAVHCSDERYSGHLAREGPRERATGHELSAAYV
ncbi:hypothetical protein [Williamsia sp. 1135]|uniref:hypothetical protein n=1 Tax=Williamsia sp. 1135 TaxID=1889262 RepID=UPI000A0FE01B|nr:hypothetical protein [Williamsia sp. 1135]ORM37800.1 hypothetical protein BFL43_03085 [Williamsia sp. 1135]